MSPIHERVSAVIAGVDGSALTDKVIWALGVRHCSHSLPLSRFLKDRNGFHLVPAASGGSGADGHRWVFFDSRAMTIRAGAGNAPALVMLTWDQLGKWILRQALPYDPVDFVHRTAELRAQAAFRLHEFDTRLRREETPEPKLVARRQELSSVFGGAETTCERAAHQFWEALEPPDAPPTLF